MYATAPWLECLIAAPILHEREANNYSFADLASMPAGRPRFFKSHANFGDLPRAARVKTIIVSGAPQGHVREHVAPRAREARVQPRRRRGRADAPRCARASPTGSSSSGARRECGCGSTTRSSGTTRRSTTRTSFLKYEDLIDDPREHAPSTRASATRPRSSRRRRQRSMDAMKSGKTGIYAGNVRKGGVGNWRKKIDGDWTRSSTACISSRWRARVSSSTSWRRSSCSAAALSPRARARARACVGGVSAGHRWVRAARGARARARARVSRAQNTRDGEGRLRPRGQSDAATIT